MDIIGVIIIKSMTQCSTKMIFAVLDVSLIMGLNIVETYKVFFTLIAIRSKKTTNVKEAESGK